ncbi:MAG: 2-oxoglutarate dehydrogenase, E2 component, dihydrolipoamide succinyltransferase [Acidimicrobiales bacterium]
MADVEMPQLGETVTEGTITRWFKAVGDAVEEDEPLFEVSTDKVDSEVPSPVSGTVTEILVEEGDTVDVGTKLAVVGDAGDAPAADDGEGEGDEAEAAPQEPAAEPDEQPAEEPKKQPAPKPAEEEKEQAAASPSDGGGSSKLLSPVVRKLVNENDLDIDAISGTGPGGRITRDDVLDALDAGTAKAAGKPAAAPDDKSGSTSGSTSGSAPSKPAAPPAPAPRAGERDTTVPHSRIRLATAAHMRRSIDTSAHVYASIEVDFESVEHVRRAQKDAFKADEGFSLTYLPFIARAVVDALREYPEVNSSFGENELIVHNYVNLGIAVDLDFKGLLVPVIADADGMRMRAIARSVRDLAARARSKKLGPDELQGGTFTITNPGPYGTTMTMPIINQPQVATLSTDGIKRRPVVIETPDGDEAIAIHSVGNITLTWDHRAFDGAYAAAFLKQVKDLIESMDWSQELG